MRKILSFLFFILWAFNFLFPQSPEWVNFTANKNILSLTVEGNYIWVGTKGGLVKLNMLTGEKVNYNSANSGLLDNLVLAIAIDLQGNKWMGTEKG
jgi:ligand-binding sensor domain-containing protein